MICGIDAQALSAARSSGDRISPASEKASSGQMSVPLASKSCSQDQYGARKRCCSERLLQKKGREKQGGDRNDIAHYSDGLRAEPVGVPEIESVGKTGVNETDDQDRDQGGGRQFHMRKLPCREQVGEKADGCGGELKDCFYIGIDIPDHLVQSDDAGIQYRGGQAEKDSQKGVAMRQAFVFCS